MTVTSADAPSALIASLAEKYMWWPGLGASGHSEERIIAQVMDIGTYEDILRLETALGRERLADVLRQAQPGWISARSWAFWRGRLLAQAGLQTPEHPPKRSFHAASL